MVSVCLWRRVTLGVYEALEKLSGIEHRASVLRTPKIQCREGTVLWGTPATLCGPLVLMGGPCGTLLVK